jgi:hypothetical protein
VRRAWLIGALSTALAAALGGCSFCVGTGCTTDGANLAHEVQQQLGKVVLQRGLPPLPPVTCPHSIKNQTGATTTCYAKGNLGGGERGIIPIKVTVTGVAGSIVNLHFVTGKPEPLGSPTTAARPTAT